LDPNTALRDDAIQGPHQDQDRKAGEGGESEQAVQERDGDDDLERGAVDEVHARDDLGDTVLCLSICFQVMRS
jgi:hypothetical protein